jgi:hypothetical protein
VSTSEEHNMSGDSSRDVKKYTESDLSPTGSLRFDIDTYMAADLTSLPDNTPVELELWTVRHIMKRLQMLDTILLERVTAGSSTCDPAFFATLRSNGVLKYKNGGLEIEMKPSAVDNGAADESSGDTLGYETKLDPDIYPSGFGLDYERAKELLAERRAMISGEVK